MEKGTVMHSAGTEELCLHELFEKQAAARASEPAILCPSGTLTYQDIEHRANKLAHYLKKQGARPGTFVGIYFKRSEQPIIAILATLKAGAAYVPIDPQFPIERIRFILKNTNVSILLTDQTLAENAKSFFKETTIVTDTDERLFEYEPITLLSRNESGVTPEDLCYIIYTSGTTGRPKGVMTRHRNVVSFTTSFNERCGVNGRDRVYQGFSLGFDGSVEEIWMAFAQGATLVVGPPDIGHDAREVARFLTDNKVTYFSTVPTFLSMIDTELPSVRLLVVSGEQCPSELATKWSNHGRAMLNVYGPTETTVNTTVARLAPGKKVTIGKPLRGYDIFIRDERGNPVPPGETGELYIGGSGVSRGYMNNAEMTAKHFIADPGVHGSKDTVLYKTGDLVHYNDENELVFLGRIDTQVKIRGYRIELAEIESVLLELAPVRSAAVKVFERDGLKTIAAFVVQKHASAKLDTDAIAEFLNNHLPQYMVPAFLDEVSELPVLTSGKIDRSRLPEPKTPLRRTKKNIVPPATDTQRALIGIWEKMFAVSPVSAEEDFFLDLGGYSLLAVQMISQVRSELQTEITVRDVYRHSTVKKLAAHIDASKSSMVKECGMKDVPKRKQSSRQVFEGLPRFVRWSCVSLQAVSLYAMYALGTIPLAAILLMYLNLSKGLISIQTVATVVAIIGIAGFPALIGLSVVAKWLIIGRYVPGNYPVWGWYYFRFWLATRLQTLCGGGFLVGTPFFIWYLRLMGAKVGKNCMVASSQCYISDLLTIGDNTSICAESQLLGYRVEDGLLKIGSVSIGNDCFVGISSALGLNTRMENGALLDDLSLLPDDQIIPAKESRRGSPCLPAPVSVPKPKAGADIRRHRLPALYAFLHLVSLYAVELFLLLASLPTLFVAVLAYRVDNLALWIGLIVFALPLYEITFCLLLVVVKRVVLGPAKPGVFPINGWRFVRVWLIDSLLNLSRLVVLPVYTTLYYLPWVRMLGAKVGARAEFSVISQMMPDLTIVEEESFLADGSIIGGIRFYDGLFQLETTHVGRRTFVGNSAVIPTGSTLGDNCLIGVISAPPSEHAALPSGTEWLGSPSFLLPHRKKVEGFPETATFRPTKKLYAHRLFVDALRILIPSLIEILGIIALFALLNLALKSLPFPAFVAISPLITCVVGLFMALAVVGVKNLAIGKFTPVIKPLWSPYVWWNEVVNGAYEAVAAPVITMFFGTPFIAWYLRLLGCAIGKHAFIETALFGEFDLVHIGDFAALNNNTIIQNHLFEDRIFKASTITIGDECSTGNMSVVLYDSTMGQGTSIGPLSLLMKGEELPPWTAWTGIPVEKNDSKRLGSVK
jgi:non-ribosomal peptide synthetase-like protein